MYHDAYSCGACNAQFLPYKRHMICPNCGVAVPEQIIESYEGVVDRIVQAMKSNKQTHGKYVSGKLGNGTLEEDIRLITFQIFDQIEEEKPSDVRQRIERIIDESNWRSRQYFKNHVHMIALEVLDRWRVMNH